MSQKKCKLSLTLSSWLELALTKIDGPLSISTNMQMIGGPETLPTADCPQEKLCVLRCIHLSHNPDKPPRTC